MSELLGNIGNDSLIGTVGGDTIFGKGGNDTVSGGTGNDVLFGDSKAKGESRPAGSPVSEDYKAKVIFQGESAGYKNTLGMYVINEDGTLSDVQILFANASLKNSGGDLVGGVSSTLAILKAGQRVGFFIAPDAFSKAPAALTEKGATFEFRDSSNKIAKLSDAADISLYSVNPEGVATQINTASGTSLFFTEKGLNADGLDHVRVTVDAKTGIVKVGFEDLLNGGDRDFDDTVFSIDVGQKNAEAWPSFEPPKEIQSRNDVINGGDGDDLAYGNAGNDRINGDNGNDTLDGGSGNDTLGGGKGDDVLYGRSGDDALYGDDGNDLIEASSGNDRIWDGAGNDTVNAGTGRDTVWVGLGDDIYNGGDGFDIIDFSGAKSGLTLDVSKKTAVSGLGKDAVSGFESFIGTKYDDVMRGDKNATTFNGGDGNDWFRGLGGADVFTGGAGKDTFAYSAKDVWFEKVHLGVDRIRDFTLGQDKLDLFEITKNYKGEKFELLKLEQVEKDVRVWANLGAENGDWQQVVVLEKNSAEDLSAKMADWLIV